MINNVLAYPELYSISKISNCNVCKSAYTTSLHHPSWGLLKHLTPILFFFQKYWFSILLLCFTLLFLSGLLLLSFLLNFAFFLSVFVAFCYLKGVRPRFYASSHGIRLGFIRVGQPVPGLAAGILITANTNMNDGIFINSKILITAYSPILGAVGFIINKTLGNTLHRNR
jgi:hypothetical protein